MFKFLEGDVLCGPSVAISQVNMTHSVFNRGST